MEEINRFTKKSGFLKDNQLKASYIIQLILLNKI